MKRALAAVVVTGIGLIAGSCDSRQDSKVTAAPESKGVVLPSIGPGTAKCNLNTKNPGPMVRGGHADVHIEGPHVSIEAKHVPALCGPVYNYDVPKLNAKAGDGLMLETCLPEGTVQLLSYTRIPGKQPLHSATDQGGTEVTFNKNQGATYSSRGLPSDNIVLSADMWRADVDVELQDVMGNDKLRAKMTFACPNPSPLELKEARAHGEGAPASPVNKPTEPEAPK
jgi:hypothetical protein